MNCTKCNAEIPAGKNFCVECGEHLPEQPQVRKCAKCGAVIPDCKNFCIECGEHLPNEKTAAKPEPEPRKCKKCGSVIPANKNFCVECGEPVADNMETRKNTRIRRCSGAQCRTPIPEGSSVCPKCGLAYNENLDRALCAAETPLAPGAMYAIAGIMVAVNAILFAVSEFLFPEIRSFAYIAGICVVAIPVVIFFMSGSFGFRHQPKVVKLVFYAAFGIAALLSCVNFCWNSELMSKYSLFCALRKSGKYKFAPSFQWRKGIRVVVPGDSKIRELYRLQSGYRYWYFAYNSSNMQWVEGFNKVDPDLALDWIRKSNESHALLANINQQKVQSFFETRLKEKNRVHYLFYDTNHKIRTFFCSLAYFKKNPEIIIDRIRKNYPIEFDESDVVFE